MRTGRQQWPLLAALLLVARGAVALEQPLDTVRLSNGISLTGRVHVPNDSILIRDETAGHWYTVRTDEIRTLENLIEKQSMEEKWLFRESGLDDKVFTGRYYPVRHYRTRITFHDGSMLTGHIIARTLYVDTGDEKHRFILCSKQEGKVGEELEDLIYVCAVTFGTEGTGVRGTIEGTVQVPEGERLCKVLALNRDKLFTVDATFDRASDRFRADGCTEGRYDIVVVTDKALYIYFSREKDKDARRLDNEAVREVQSWVDKLRDFFHTQRVLYAAGNSERAFTLVWKERRGGTTLEGLECLHRYDIWAMHKPKEEWQIERRFFLWRIPSGDPNLKPLEVVVTPALGGHGISAGAVSLELQIRLARNKEQPIPPHTEGDEDGKKDDH